MKKRKVRLTFAQMGELVAELLKRPDKPDSCFSDDDLIGYVLERLAPEDADRVEKHIEACSSCSAVLEDLFTAAEYWQSPESQTRLDALRDRVLSKLQQSGSFEST
jgi:hypothetical protein